MKSFTYKTVAEDAGVSEKTVARVIHNSGLVSSATRKRVIDALNRGGFFMQKQSLATNVVFVLSKNDFYYKTAVVLMEYLSKHNIRFRMTDWKKEFFEEILADATVVIWGTGVHPKKIEQIRKINPEAIHISLGYEKFEGIYIGMDSLMGGQLAARHLHKNGHSSIAVFEPVSSPEHSDRISSFVGEMKMLNHDCNIVFFKGNDLAETMITEKIYEKVTAFFCVHECISYETGKTLTENGFRIPEDFSIVGCDIPRQREDYTWPIDYISLNKEDCMQWLKFLVMSRPMVTQTNAINLLLAPVLFINGSVKKIRSEKRKD